ncbi:hypothetical protein [Rhodopirellula europaea]|uniref:hypothetical protein n=1 Tax=Rhodopirellula europaea TaxID=1263866 RepID=UPI0030EDDDC0
MIKLANAYYRAIDNGEIPSSKFSFESHFKTGKTTDYAAGKVFQNYPVAAISYWRSNTPISLSEVERKNDMSEGVEKGVIFIGRNRVVHVRESRKVAVSFPSKMYGTETVLNVLPWQWAADIRPGVKLSRITDISKAASIVKSVSVNRTGAAYEMTRTYNDDAPKGLDFRVEGSLAYGGAITRYHSIQPDIATNTSYEYARDGSGTLYLSKLTGKHTGKRSNLEWSLSVTNHLSGDLDPGSPEFRFDKGSLAPGTQYVVYGADGTSSTTTTIGEQSEDEIFSDLADELRKSGFGK